VGFRSHNPVPMAETQCLALEGAIAQLFFNASCVEHLTVEGVDCPADEVRSFMDSFAGENKMHVQVANVLVLFVVIAAANLGGVPRPASVVSTIAMLIWTLMSVFQWVCAVLSFAAICLSYDSMFNTFESCLQPWDPTKPDGPRLMGILSLSTFMFQPVIVSKVLIIVVQPIAIVVGIRGSHAEGHHDAGAGMPQPSAADKLEAPAAPDPSTPTHPVTLALFTALMGAIEYFFSHYLRVTVGVAVGLYAVSAVVWLLSLAAVFSSLFVPLLATSLVTAVVAISLVNSFSAIAPRVGSTVDRFMTFNFYWCSWMEISTAAHILHMAPVLWVLLRYPAVFLLALARVPLFIGGGAGFAFCVVVLVPLIFVRNLVSPREGVGLCNVGIDRYKPLLHPPQVWTAAWGLFTNSKPPNMQRVVNIARRMSKEQRASTGMGASGQGQVHEDTGRGVLDLREVVVQTIAAAHDDDDSSATTGKGERARYSLSLAMNHAFASVFVVCLFIYIVGPPIVYGTWTAHYCYGSRPSELTTYTDFVEEVYTYAYDGFTTFRIPSLDMKQIFDLGVTWFLAALPRWRELTPTEQITGSRALAAVSVLLGVLRPFVLFLEGFLELCIDCKLKKMEVVQLGVTARVAAAVDPSEFEKPHLNLSYHVFTDPEVEAMAENMLRDNHIIQFITFEGTKLGDRGLQALAAVLPTVDGLRRLELGLQKAQLGAQAIGRAIAQMHGVEKLGINGLVLKPLLVRSSGALTASNKGVDDTCAQLLTHFLEALPADVLVKGLHLHATRIGDRAANIVRAMRLQTVLELDLNGSEIESLGAKLIGSCISEMPSLALLDVGENPRIRDGASEVLKSLSNHRKLHTLVLSNCGLSSAEIQYFPPKLPALVILDLAYNHLRDEGLAAITQRLVSGYARLAVLRLTATGLTTKGATAVAGIMHGLPALSELYLDHNGVTDAFVGAIAKGCSKARVLTRLEIGAKSLDDAAAVCVEQLLVQMNPAVSVLSSLGISGNGGLTSGIQVLDLWPNSFTQNGVRHVANGLAQNNAIKFVRIEESRWMRPDMMKISRNLTFTGRNALADRAEALVLSTVASSNRQLQHLTIQLRSTMPADELESCVDVLRSALHLPGGITFVHALGDGTLSLGLPPGLAASRSKPSRRRSSGPLAGVRGFFGQVQLPWADQAARVQAAVPATTEGHAHSRRPSVHGAAMLVTGTATTGKQVGRTTALVAPGADEVASYEATGAEHAQVSSVDAEVSSPRAEHPSESEGPPLASFRRDRRHGLM